MRGDFSRLTHRPGKHYSGVVKQQGRIDLDSDWNENVAIRQGGMEANYEIPKEFSLQATKIVIASKS